MQNANADIDIYEKYKKLASNDSRTVRSYRSQSLPSIAVLDDPITVTEVVEALSNVPSSSSCGNLPVPTDVFKRLFNCAAFLLLFVKILDVIYHTAQVPSSWNEGFVTPVPKPGKPVCLKNLRPIAVTPLPNRILSKIISSRIDKWVDLQDDQFGFRSGRSTVDATFVLNSVLESTCHKSQYVHAAFIDFSSAFDTVNHSKLWLKLEKKGVSAILLKFLKTCYSKAVNRVKWNGKQSKQYKLEKGVRQGEPTSGVLFNIYLDDLTYAVKTGRTTTLKINGREIFLIKYADYVCVLSSSPEELQISLDRLAAYANDFDLVINIEKSYSMVFRGSKRKRIDISVKIGDQVLHQVREFKYLGFYLNEELSRKKSSTRILNNAFAAYAQLCQRLADLPDDCPTKVFEKMLSNTTTAIGSYGSELFGPNKDLDALYIRALRHFSAYHEKPQQSGCCI